jgi:hypothetical protein
VVSLTAEPTPAFSGGTAPMIASVAAGIIRPKPTDITTSAMATSMYSPPAVMRLTISRPTAAMARPSATTILLPKRSASRAALGDTMIMVAAIGSRRTPACRAV